MLKLQHINGGVYVFNVNDWVALRKNVHITGILIGNVNLHENLPCKLLPEEFLYLQYNNLVKLVEQNGSFNTSVQKYEQYEKDLLLQQQILYKNDRKRKLYDMIDEIVAAKKKRGDDREPEEILNEELDKSINVTKNNMIWPILTESIFSNNFETDNSKILDYSNELKYLIFKDLLERGYYVTYGHKFGGDFLVYLGDPVIYHAIFIVRCVTDPNIAINPTEIVAFGRLGTSVRKRAVLASLDENKKISYITINWLDS